MSDSLRPHRLQHTRPSCPSLSPRHSPLRWWCHPTISSSAVPFSCPQSFPESGSFPISQLFTSGGQSTGVSASALPMNSIPLNSNQFNSEFISFSIDCLISLQSKDSQASSLAPQFESINSLAVSLLYGPTLTTVHDYWKNHSFDYTDLCQQSNVFAF